MKILMAQGNGAVGRRSWTATGMRCWSLRRGCSLLLLPTGESRPPAEEERADREAFSSWRSWRRSWPAPCPASMERGRRRSC